MIETHTAWVFFIGERVFKLKKPVTFPFLDFSTREARELACHAEVALNRRLSPDVYLGVSTVLAPDGSPCDHLVVMKRMPYDRRLSLLLDSDGAEANIRAVARAVAAFHAHADTSRQIGAAASPERIRESWERELGELADCIDPIVPGDVVGELRILGRRYLDGRAPLLEARQKAGRIVDGHGDLLADDIFCLEDGPRILDCLDFDDRLRHGDVVADVAFLAMDLERLGRPDLAAQFVADYREFSGESCPESLVDFYVAQRALVRAKVACLALRDGLAADAFEAARLVRVALRHLERARVRMVIVGGLPGTGKTTLATALAEEMGWALLSSDVIRKELFTRGRVETSQVGFRQGMYEPANTDATYGELILRARDLAWHGQSVVIDASWIDAGWRAIARTLAQSTASDLVQLRCAVPRKIAHRRLRARARTGGASDATAAIASAMEHDADPWLDSVEIDGAVSPAAMLESALAVMTEYALVADTS